MQSKGLQESSPAPQFEASILWRSAFFMVQFSHLYMTAGKMIALIIWTVVSKVVSLLFNILCRFVIKNSTFKKLISWHRVHHFMANRWGNSGNSDRFIFLDSRITANSDCSHEIKRYLLFGRKAMTNLDSVLKSRDITLLTKIHIVKAIIFPAVMYRCES